MATYPTLNTASQYHRAATIKKVFIKTGSELWQYLGDIRNGKLTITPYTTNDTTKKNLTFSSFTFSASFESLQTSVLELEKIDKITDGSCSFLFQTADAGAIPTTTPTATEGWFYVSNSQVNAKAKFNADGDPSNNQFTEFTIDGTLLSTELDACVKAVILDVQFHTSETDDETFSNNHSVPGGTIFGYYNSSTAGDVTGIPANRKPCGFSSVQLQNTNDPTYITLGATKNCKLVFDFVTENDSIGKPLAPYAVDVDVEYDALVTDAATLLQLDTINSLNTDVKITLRDGKIFTLASALGVQTSFDNSGDFDKNRVLKFKHVGRIPVSSFDGVVA
jgi:hypothetical protein